MEHKDPYKTFKNFLNTKLPLNENINEADDEEKEEEEVEDALADLADDEEVDIDIEEPAEEEPSLDGDASEVQDHLEQAMEVARSMGDAKLETQIGNTIVYLNRSQYSKVDENIEELEGTTSTDNDGFIGGYIEVMGPDYDSGIGLIKSAWNEWKNGPATEANDIDWAREDIIKHITRLLD